MQLLGNLPQFGYVRKFPIYKVGTLESGINVAPGKFGKKNKRSPIYTLYLY